MSSFSPSATSSLVSENDGTSGSKLVRIGHALAMHVGLLVESAGSSSLGGPQGAAREQPSRRAEATHQ